MKFNMKRYLLTICAALALVSGLGGCQQKEEGPMKWVDLRYRAEDSYSLPWNSPEAFSFLVKSTDPWTVRSYNPDWCTITPAEGEGNPVINEAQTYTVTVQYADNAQLDDRVDTLEIKSDYWVGKLITVYQKGNAYLDVKDEEQSLEIGEEGGALEFAVSANQDWSAVVIEGADWLTITSGATGSLDGKVALSTVENTGEKRYGAVSVLDRHGVERAVVKVTQNGVQLDPATMEVRAAYNQGVYELTVVSNAAWKAEKVDEKAMWLDIENPENNGEAVLRITMNDNEGNSIKKTAIKLTTIAEPGQPVVVREVVVKQAYLQVPERMIFNAAELANWSADKGVDPVYLGAEGTYFEATSSGSVYARLYRSGMPMGTHTFRWHTFSPEVRVRLWWTFGNNNEIKFNLRDRNDGAGGFTEISTSPSGPDSDFVNVEGIDMTVPHEMTVKFTPSEINEGYCHVQFILDGVEFQSFDTNDNSAVPECTWQKTIGMYFGCYTGSAVCEWYDYTEPFSWD